MSGLAELLVWQLGDFPSCVLGGVVTFCTLGMVHVWLTRRGQPQRQPQALTQTPPAARAVLTDALYWLVSPTFRVASRAVALCVLAALGLAFGADVLPAWTHGYGPVARQPRPLLLIELVLLADLCSYFSHRLLHRVPWLWRFHAVHHSSQTVQWHSTLRMHPVNDLLTYVGNIVPALLLGFPVEALAPYLPLLGLYAVYCHSESNVKHGVLSAVLTSPRYHRWHHTSVDEGGNANFSGVFSLWDRLFGTYYMPEDRLPERFGVDTPDMPESLLGQLAYPWTARTRAKAA